MIVRTPLLQITPIRTGVEIFIASIFKNGAKLTNKKLKQAGNHGKKKVLSTKECIKSTNTGQLGSLSEQD